MDGHKAILLDALAELSRQLDLALVDNARHRQTLLESDKTVDELRRHIRGIEAGISAMNAAVAAPAGGMTIMQAVLETMKDKPNGMTAREILDALNANYYGGKLQRHSLSPQLSRLKDRDKKIEWRNDRWFLLPEEPSLFTPKK